MIINGIEYEFIMGSDVIRGGVYLEVSQSNTNPLLQIAEAFYSDINGEFYITTFINDVPLPLIETLIEKAKKILSPT